MSSTSASTPTSHGAHGTVPTNSGRPNDIPRFVTYTSPANFASSADGAPARATTLPLNLIAVIVSYLDDIADIARVTRTSRLLYYMTLPELYKSVDLHSYKDIRYKHARPEGFGSGSPLQMALNGLVTKPHASLVQKFRIWGEWNELGVEDFAKGRVPDNSMMLNIILRAAIDKMSKLQNFKWELDCKPLKTLYQGLGAHNTLTGLAIKFPSSRLPRPTVMIPPMANLRALKITGIDPLCYPDDISVLLLHSRKLEDLRLQFSPRMRQEAESSLNLGTYFGRCLSAGYKLPLKHLAIQNFYGPNMEGVAELVDHDTCQSICALDMFGGTMGLSQNVFLDDTWKNIPVNLKTNFKATRCNEAAPQQVNLLSHSTGLERFYMVSAKSAIPGATADSPSVPMTPGETPPEGGCSELGKQYLYALTRYHGSTLKHLLLSDQWTLGQDDISELIRGCPNLEQLGLAICAPELDTIRLLMPYLPKLHSLRILASEFVTESLKGLDLEQHALEMGYKLYKAGAKQVRWIGAADKVFHVGETIQDENGEWRRDVKPVTWQDVQHIEIWGLDCLDIGPDPVHPFSP